MMISLFAIPGASGLFFARAETASSAISEEVSKPRPKRTPMGYICQSGFSNFPRSGWARRLTFQGRSSILNSGRASRVMQPIIG